MTITQLRRVFTAVLLCMPAHAIINSFIADTGTCSPILQRVCLFLRGASLAASCAAFTAGRCNSSGISKGHESEDPQKSRFGASYTEHGDKVRRINEREVQKMEEQRVHETKKRRAMKKLEKEISKWYKRQEKNENA